MIHLQESEKFCWITKEVCLVSETMKEIGCEKEKQKKISNHTLSRFCIIFCKKISVMDFFLHILYEGILFFLSYFISLFRDLNKPEKLFNA